jgi:hypothetical protein
MARRMSLRVWFCLNLREFKYVGIASSLVFLRSVVGLAHHCVDWEELIAWYEVRIRVLGISNYKKLIKLLVFITYL